eukprot:1063836_1
MSSELCAENRRIGIIYNDYIFAPITSFAAFSVVVCICIYVKAYIHEKLHTSRSLFYLGMLLFMLVLCGLISYCIQISQHCHNMNIYYFCKFITVTSYSFQNIIMIVVFFYRLMAIFKGSAFKLSKKAITMFWVFFIPLCILTVFGTILYIYDISNLVLVLAGAWTVLLIIALTILFIYKLYKVFKSTE